MKTLEKLAKKDKMNLVTKKDGSLTKRAIEAIKDYRNNNGKFYITYTSGSGRFTKNSTNNSIYNIVELLGYKFTEGNDSPRNGRTGDYVEVSKKAYNNIKNLIK